MTDDQTTPMRPFNASLPMALLRARESAMRLFRPMLADHDLTEQQWRVLRALTALDDSDEAPDAGALAARTFLLAPSLSRILTNLQDRELIERHPHETDNRRSLVQLTESGRDLVRSIAPESEELYSVIESSFGTDRLRRLLHELDELARVDFLPDEQAAEEATASNE